ncbi:hypothetical protein QTI66_10650 [Variovorax sp. J22R133]|uniref:hypothetical protein n=1 Tax=Variovorax brevis TaxID=3053503 RepID=UPI002577C869|nr:hypothetical protein [Variovorax sp. J22R133]MDM0112608.1 hypothetical protein [Variovorax sp. J22R133]
MNPTPPATRLLRGAVMTLAFVGIATAAEPEGWTVIGHQGLVQAVLVPSAQASQQDAYERQIARLCEPERTCFINFYTNSTAAPLVMPLPDAIANEATAIYRFSAKNGVKAFNWSCRLKVQGQECF